MAATKINAEFLLDRPKQHGALRLAHAERLGEPVSGGAQGETAAHGGILPGLALGGQRRTLVRDLPAPSMEMADRGFAASAYSFFGFHSRASRCASAICAGVMRLAAYSRFRTAVS